MAMIFYRLIKNPNVDTTIDDVPSLWRAQVQALLDADKQETE